MPAPPAEILDALFAFRRNLVVAASAGTGKTHGLVGVIVHVLVGASELGGEGIHPPVDPSRIVATTFSRKAAAEIRARVVEELERLAARDPGSKYRANIDAASRRGEGARAWSDAQLALRARRALDGIARAQIGTLHGFASTIVRSHALEAGLSPSFEIASEDDARLREEEVIVRVLEARADESRALIDVAGGVDRLVAQVSRALARLEEDGRGARALSVCADDARRIDATMRALVDHARALQGEPNFAEPCRALLRAWDASDEAVLSGAAAELCGVALRGKLRPEAVAFKAFRDSLSAPSGAANPERGRRLVRTWMARDAFDPAAHAARDLLAACQDELANEVRRTSVLGFGDVLRVARDVLRDHVDVAREIGRELDVLLVDEFQDTSRLQRDLVQLVWARDDARVAGEVPRLRDVRPHGLFVVGDRKQSIYGFRGADVSVFAELCVGLAGAPAREALGIAPGTAWEPETPVADFVSLRHNRRGNAPLLAFANAFSRERFKVRDPPAQLFEIEYVGETEDLLVPPERRDHSATPQTPQTPQTPRTTWIRFGGEEPARIDEATAIAARARAIIASGEPRVRGNPPMWRDLAVLAATNEMLDAAAFALAQAGVPHVVAGRGFWSASEVRDLARMLALVLDPSDKLAMLEVLRGPWVGVHDATLIGLTDAHRGLQEVGPAWDYGERRALVRPEDRAALARVRRVVGELWRNVDRLGPAGILREAVRELELEEVLVLLPRGEQRIANVRKLIALAERETSVVRFLERLDDRMAREAAESEAATFSDEDDAVRLLTVHASKGLDFPIVFVPQAGAAPRPRERGALALDLGTSGAPPILSVRIADRGAGPLEAPSYARALEAAERRERAERQRLSYVAVTRASEAMILVGDKKRPKTGDSRLYMSTDAATLRELPEGTPLVIEDAPPALPVASECGPPPASPVPLVDPRLPPPAWRSLATAPTALQDFAHCPRRFQLAHLLGLPERSPSGDAAARSHGARDEPEKHGERGERGEHGANAMGWDARAEGTLAHRVLERLPREAFGTAAALGAARDLLAREGVPVDHPTHATVLARVTRFATGEYAARVADARAGVAREVPFALRVPDRDGRTLALRGSIDVLVTWPDGAVDVVDYKRARGPSAEPYAFQLEVYRLAAAQLVPDAPRARAGIVFLGGDAAEPVWRAPASAPRVRARLAQLADELMEARWTDRFPRAAPETCRAIRCGYFRRCHPGLPA